MGTEEWARLLHLWYLVQRGYSSALFVPLSGFSERSRKGYYDAYTLIEQNARISGVLDVTPFLVYFIENVYHKLSNALPAASTTEHFQAALASGGVTGEGKGLVAVRTVRLWRRGVLYKAAGAGFRQRRLCYHPQFRPEIRGDGPPA